MFPPSGKQMNAKLCTPNPATSYQFISKFPGKISHEIETIDIRKTLIYNYENIAIKHLINKSKLH